MDKFSLLNKKALVTGSSRGIGKAIAIGLAKAGADVVCTSTAEDGTADTIRKIQSLKRRAYHVTVDLSDRKSQDHLVKEAIVLLGGLDILVNNAGTIYREKALDHKTKDWDRVMEVNLTAAFRIAQEAAKYMSGQGSGKIINVASLLSHFGGVTVPAYTASKHGLAGLTKALSNEWAGLGIQVNAIAPGYIRTDNTQALQDNTERYESILSRIPAGRWGEPEDLVGTAVFLASQASDYINGSMITVDGGWTGR